jgi:Ca-activated chloride channel family protein
MAEFHFLRPQLLLALIPLLPLWWLLWRGQDQVARLAEMIDPHLLEHLLAGESGVRRLRPVHTLGLTWLLSVLALAGPTWEREPSPFADDDAGLVVLLKVSGTMMAGDVQPSRLERAKHKLRDLLEVRKGSSTGLIVYSGSAHLVMPLTRDDRIVSAMVEDLTPDLMPVEGDVLSEAFDQAKALLNRARVAGSVLVLADNVAPAQADAIGVGASSLPAQFIAVNSAESPVDPGLERAASLLGAPVWRLTVDQTDVQRVAQRAQSAFQTVAAASEGERWRDGGYLLLPLIALLALMWSRRGWVLR